MNFIRKLFGLKPKLVPPSESPAPPDAPATMKAWDDYGRVIEISREDWRLHVLPGNFEKAWDNPDNLANLVNSALNDGFIADSLEPARRLLQIDPDPKRSAMYLAVILLQLQKFAEAEKLLTDTMQKLGEDGVLLTNLAKAQNGRGDDVLAERTLWHALELDPNQHNGFMWYVAIQRERGGDLAEETTLARIAALPGSWRALVWQARRALESRKLEEALAIYRNCLQKAGHPVPSDLLMQISGDLGNQGHLPEILQLVAPQYDVPAHGLIVGNNLIKAYFDLGQLNGARKILDKLYAQNRGDWKEHLQFWDTELAKAQVALNNMATTEPRYSMLTIEGPVWLKPTSPAAELFPAKPSESPRICLIGSSAEVATNSKRPQLQMSDSCGLLSRALPLFLAEQLELRADARVQTLIPWLVGESAGFVLSGGPWEDDAVATVARQNELKNDYVISIFLKAVTDPWQANVRLIRSIDAKCLGSFTASLSPSTLEKDVPGLIQPLLVLLQENADLQTSSEASPYQLPEKKRLPDYLLRLEQLLAVKCAGMDGVPSGFLHGEREILDGNLQLCLDYPLNIGFRILLAQTVSSMARVRPEVLPEYRNKVAKLQREHPLPEPAQSLIQRVLDESSKT